jgi:hypothetical protein
MEVFLIRVLAVVAGNIATTIVAIARFMIVEGGILITSMHVFLNGHK